MSFINYFCTLTAILNAHTKVFYSIIAIYSLPRINYTLENAAPHQRFDIKLSILTNLL